MRRSLTALVAATLAACVLAGCGIVGSTRVTPPAAGPPGGAVVTRVVDGDTIIVKIDGRSERVRLIGIDTPESVKPNTPVQCFAKEASARTKALLPAGTPVRLVGDVDGRDRYQRLLAYVYRQRDDLFVNRDLVDEGFAVTDTIPPNVAHAAEFVSAAAAARRAGLGLWSRCGSSIPVHDRTQLPSPP